MNLLNYMTKTKRRPGDAGTTVSAPAAVGGRGPFRVWKMVLVALVASAVGGSLVYGLDTYRRRVAWERTNCVNPTELRLSLRPTWMTPEICEEIQSSLRVLPARLSVMDPSSDDRVAACLEGCPWVRKVHYVRLDRPQAGKTNGMEVSLTFRRPVAFVAAGQGASARYHMVDRDGVRLGSEAFPEPQLGDRVLMVLTGVTSAAPEAGEKWVDPKVQAGAAVANLLVDRVAAFKLSWIDVSNLGRQRNPREAEILVYTKQGRTRIVWGGRPGERRTEIVEECTAAQKVRWLDMAYERLGGIHGRVAEIDLVERQIQRMDFRRASGAGIRG